MNHLILRLFHFQWRFMVCAFGLALVSAEGQGRESQQFLNHQGRVAVNGLNFDGAGHFKFALVDEAGAAVWSNAAMATVSAGSAESIPTMAVDLSVSKGLYAVVLGETKLANMAVLPVSVFVEHHDLWLRVWFDDGVHGFQQIKPDHRLAAAPFAAFAERAQSSAGFLGELSGEVTGGQDATSLSNAAVIGKKLNGFATLTGRPSSDDTILSAIGKLDGAASLMAPLASPSFTGTVSGISASMVGLGNVDNTSDADKPVSTAQFAALDLKAPLASPTFTGTVSGITATMVGLGSVNNTSDATKPVSTAQQAALDLKAPLASPSFTGVVQLAGGTSSSAPLRLTNGTSLTSPVFGAVEFDGTNLYLTNNSLSPTRKTLAFTDGAVGSAINFTGALAGDVTGTQGATTISTSVVTGKPLTGFSSVTGTLSAADTILSAINKLNGNDGLKANLASPTFTGTVRGITASMVGLGNVSNTSDANKPVSTAQQAAFDLKAPLASPSFTGTVSGVTATMVGLGNVNNTSDANKPVSTAQQAALDLKAPLVSPSFAGSVQLAGGTSSSAPLKFASGTSLASPVFGAVEFDGTNLYFTNNSSNPTRRTLAFTDGAVVSAIDFTGALGGEVTGTQNATTISASVVTGKQLVGFSSVAGTLGAADTILSAINKLNGNDELKANLASPTFTGNVSGITATMVGLGSVNNTSDASKPISTAQQAALDLKAPLASPTFTGTVSGITATMVGLGSVNNTSDASKPISTAQQAALDLKAPLASPTFTGTVSGVTATMVGLGSVNNTSDANKPVSTAQQAALDSKAPLASPSFTGVVQLAGGTSSSAPLRLASGTSLTSPAFGAVEFDGTNLYLTNNSSSPTRKTLAFTDGAVGSAINFTGTLVGDVTGTQAATAIAASVVTGKPLTGYASGAGTLSAADTILSAINKLNGNDGLKANLASPTFTGTVSGITATMVGLGSVNNTSDAGKPISTAQQAALDLKAPLASPTFTGTVSGVTATMVGLGSVNNTSDANKPVSTAQQTALNLKANSASPTFTGIIQLPAGTSTVPAIRFSGGTNLATPAFGAVEFDGTNLYLTNNSGNPTRRTVAFADTPLLLNNLTAAPTLPVLAWGKNSSGQITVPSLSSVTTVAAGESHCLALLVGGSVVTWGNGAAVPGALSSVAAIAAGGLHDLAVKTDGTVVAWGSNSFGQATVPVGITNATQAAAGEKHSAILRTTGSVTAWGDNSFGQTTVPSTALTNVTAIAAGYDHTLALKVDGTVVAWGRNDAGQTDVPVGLSNVVAISAGAYHSLAVKSDGTVVAWGWDSGGQSTVPGGLSGVTKVAGGYAFSAALKSDGTVVTWGDNSNGQCIVPSGAAQIKHLAAGASHMLVVRVDLVKAQVARLDQDNVFSGNLGIQRTPTTNALEVNGAASKSTAGSWLSNSDRRIKREIQTIGGALEKLEKVRLVDFRYTQDYLSAHPEIVDRRYPNVIAQEFAEVFPDDVKSSGEKLTDGSEIQQVDTYPLTIYSAAAIKELTQKLNEQEQRIRKLEELLNQR